MLRLLLLFLLFTLCNNRRIPFIITPQEIRLVEGTWPEIKLLFSHHQPFHELTWPPLLEELAFVFLVEASALHVAPENVSSVHILKPVDILFLEHV